MQQRLVETFRHVISMVQAAIITKAVEPEPPAKIGDFRGRIRCRQIGGGF
jgi:hypothetical protein